MDNSLTVYASPTSQPCRSVIWLCLIKFARRIVRFFEQQYFDDSSPKIYAA